MMRILLTRNGVPSKKWIWTSKRFYDQKLGLPAEMADCTSRSPAAQWWVWSPKTALNKPKMGWFPMISYDFLWFFSFFPLDLPLSRLPRLFRLLRCQEGDIITAGQCRPLAKTVRFNVIKAGTSHGASHGRGMKIYPLVNVYIAMERSTIFHGKINYFYGHFQ